MFLNFSLMIGNFVPLYTYIDEKKFAAWVSAICLSPIFAYMPRLVKVVKCLY